MNFRFRLCVAVVDLNSLEELRPLLVERDDLHNRIASVLDRQHEVDESRTKVNDLQKQLAGLGLMSGGSSAAASAGSSSSSHAGAATVAVKVPRDPRLSRSSSNQR
jgi:hypothetical protein